MSRTGQVDRAQRAQRTGVIQNGRDFRIGDHVRIASQEAAAAWGFEGPLEGQIILFGRNEDETDALLSGPQWCALGRWIPLRLVNVMPPADASEPVVNVTLTRTELSLVVAALDSHVYEEGEEPEDVAEANALHDRLEKIVASLPEPAATEEQS